MLRVKPGERDHAPGPPLRLYYRMGVGKCCEGLACESLGHRSPKASVPSPITPSSSSIPVTSSSLTVSSRAPPLSEAPCFWGSFMGGCTAKEQAVFEKKKNSTIKMVESQFQHIEKVCLIRLYCI